MWCIVSECSYNMANMQSVLRVIVILAMSTRTSTLTESNTRATSGAVNCREAGWTSCCTDNNCFAPGKQCFCDFSCHSFGDCCADITDTCPKDTPGHESTIKSLLHGEVHKRQVAGAGSGSGTGNIVEIGFVLGSYRVNESELDVMVCVEVKSGVLTPAESASVTVNTSPGTAMADVDYESIVEEVMFDGNTFQELLCIEIPIVNDVYFEPVEHFSVTLICPSNNVMLDEGSMSAIISITSTETSAEDSCAEAGFATQCCVDSDDQCQSLSASCSCDLSCFQREDCCEDIIMYAVKLIDSAVSVDEAGGTMPVCAVLTGSYEGIIDNITVTLRFTDSLLAVAGDDYQPRSTELIFTAQQRDQLQPGDGAVQCVDIDIIDDSSIEGEHVFTVEIASVSPTSVVQCTSINTTFHIQDDDVAVVSLVPLPETVAEEEALDVCAMLQGVDFTDIPFTLNFTISSEQGIILTSNITFTVGEITNGTGNSTSARKECSEVSLDNDVLDWSWQLTVSLDTLHHNHLTTLSSSVTILTTTVTDDEANAVSVHFQSSDEAVTEGHRTVLCVVLNGLPTGGMSEDLTVSLTLANSTAELGIDFSLEGSMLDGGTALLFRRGSSRQSVETTQCEVIDTIEIAECREEVQFNMNITSTTPPLTIQQPLTATVSISDSNTTCICPVTAGQQTMEDNRESLYFTLLLIVSALASVLACALIVVVVLFCCYCRQHRHYYSKGTEPSPEDRVMTIRNDMAYENTDTDRTKTVSSFNSITHDGAPKDSDKRTAIAAQNEAVRYTMTELPSKPDAVVPAATETSATADYEEPIPYSSSSTSLALQSSFV